MQWNRTLTCLTLGTMLAIAGTVSAQAQMGLGLQPMRLELNLQSGGEHTDTLRLSNDSAGRARVKTQILDFYIDDAMTPQFDDKYDRESKSSCREWLQVTPRESEMGPKAIARERYTFNVPADTPEGEYHCAVGFVTMPPVSDSGAAMGLRTAVRAVAAFYINIGKPTARPLLKDLALQSNDTGLAAVATFENQGSKTFRVQGFVEVRDADGNRVEGGEYATIPVLPERHQQFLFPLKTVLKPGKYTLYTQADVGLPEILEGSVSVVVSSAR